MARVIVILKIQCSAIHCSTVPKQGYTGTKQVQPGKNQGHPGIKQEQLVTTQGQPGIKQGHNKKRSMYLDYILL